MINFINCSINFDLCFCCQFQRKLLKRRNSQAMKFIYWKIEFIAERGERGGEKERHFERQQLFKQLQLPFFAVNEKLSMQSQMRLTTHRVQKIAIIFCNSVTKLQFSYAKHFSVCQRTILKSGLLENSSPLTFNVFINCVVAVLQWLELLFLQI